MRSEGNIRELRKIIGKNKYSNLNLAFYKLHALKYLDRIKKDDKTLRYDFLKDLISLCDLNSIKEACFLLKNRMIRAFESYEVEQISARIGYRLIIGIGYPSFVENGMLFHHIYGIPYIPGESVKGLVRFTFLLNKFPELIENPKKVKDKIEKLEEGEFDENKNLQEEYSLIFGTKKQEGLIIFFDAYPEELKEENFVIDIMNPHYWEYYRSKGKKPPAEWDNPNPIFFLALENVRFCFSLGFDPLRIDKNEGKKILKEALSYLKDGLEMFGLGAKKRKGYGWFDSVRSL